MSLDKDFYNKKEFAQIINKNPKTITNLEKKGIISKGKRDGHYVLYNRSDVINAMRHYGIIEYDKPVKDIIFTDNIDLINKANFEFNFGEFYIAKNLKEVIKNINMVKRVFIDKNFIKGEEYDFLYKTLELYDNLEIINIENEE